MCACVSPVFGLNRADDISVKDESYKVGKGKGLDEEALHLGGGAADFPVHVPFRLFFSAGTDKPAGESLMVMGQLEPQGLWDSLSN